MAISMSVKEMFGAAMMAEYAVHLNSPDRDEKNSAEAGATRLTYGTEIL